MSDSLIPAAEPAEEASPEFPGLAEFIFDAPLYASYSLIDGSAFPLFQQPGTADGHCCYCNDRSTFRRAQNSGQQYSSLAYVGDRVCTSIWVCARNPYHQITLYLRKASSKVLKIGQEPSLADIAHDAAREYRSILKGQDRNELSKAIGLAAHGVGVGSFVYMRRVFERLIYKRFETSGIQDPDFGRKRMGEKIDTLREHLPRFLIENKEIYQILSVGIHELSEAECLSFYPIMYESIIIILEEDRRKFEDNERRSRLSQAIKAFSPKT